MELHTQYGCFLSLHIESEKPDQGFKKFFEENHFLIAHNMFDDEWEEKVQLEEIIKKLLLVYEFEPQDDNIKIVYKDHKRVYLPNKLFVPLPPRSVFVYDSSKIEVLF